uniref:BED-type domain-containing protein n=1 Tax=Gongylonema pulchrum TaxID=637853 RepID=A0A183ENT3_9BILA
LEVKDEHSGSKDNLDDGMAEATATAKTLADISSMLVQHDSNGLFSSDTSENRPRRGRIAEHPCWDLVQRIYEHNCMICRICSRVIKCINTRNAMQHFRSCHYQVAVELDQSWQVKLQLKANFNRISSKPSSSSPSLIHFNMWKKRGRAAEHPSWRYFCRINRRSSNCRLCGAHVAYACSGNLMKHLKSRHIAEFTITEREWREILKVSSWQLFCTNICWSGMASWGRARGVGGGFFLLFLIFVELTTSQLILKSFGVVFDELTQLQRKKELCELRLKANASASGSEEQSPSNFMAYDCAIDETDEGLIGADGFEEEEEEDEDDVGEFLCFFLMLIARYMNNS